MDCRIKSGNDAAVWASANTLPFRHAVMSASTAGRAAAVIACLAWSVGSAKNLLSCSVGPSAGRKLQHIQQLQSFGCSLNFAIALGSRQHGHARSS